ncbi:hypothetical protein VZG28_06305 [Synechococcus elongatus IITB4]|uniref:hypothetical protein n=1 Tax=Synechococcus elongatus TaxID=32046 RepID=UPI0030D37A52
MLVDQVAQTYGDGLKLPAFLQQLKPALRSLRNRYDVDQPQVAYDAPSNQAAYLLAYYPHYVRQTDRVLREAAAAHPGFASILQQPTLNATLIGSGPLPEGLGLLQACRVLGNMPVVKAISMDINAAAWSPARRITRQVIKDWMQRLAGYSKHSPLEVREQVFDLADAQPLTPEQQRSFGRQDLVIIQNCCNEVKHQPALFAKLQQILASLPCGSAFVISDFQYGATNAAIQSLLNSDVVKQHYHVLHCPQRKIPAVTAPSVLQQHLFERSNGLWARRVVKYRALCLYRHS